MKHGTKEGKFSCTILLLMKSFMDIQMIPTIPNLIKEVPNFKKFIEEGIAME